MKDGLPAENQAVWQSPWGRIGIGLCFDLSFSRVMDRLIAAGAQGLIIPTMEPEDWGPEEHWLHAKVTPVRASEYKVPIFRLASSGISQSVTAEGEVEAIAPWPKQMATIAGELDLSNRGRLPPDRWLAPASVIAFCGLLAQLAWLRFRPRVVRSGAARSLPE
jgi:apolipoprotein N-acyltransferase